MDFARLNPWNWFKKENEQEKAIPVKREQVESQSYMPAARLGGIHSEIDHLFEDFFRNFGIESPLASSSFTGLPQPDVFKPKVDIAGSEKEYTISAELPGIEESEIDIELQGDSLIIKAEKRQEEKTEDKGYYRVERHYGAYKRVLTMPEDADPEGIKAKHKNGVLTISLPRKEGAGKSSKRIPIQS
ncbi:Hsp20/alpha crystallin family protein [Oceanidesulfovibrio indonesiensis]|uniref:Hsp20/alpha crystallin family protein n=1 Tax=Oceanidesulfovibrio indonesiensis TaxID=54767 RepID=A0A7M3MEW0_9BACT|nr:Hsp20/alpha crystallin family protein [Oceanidesulfovibrio indonesiensis]TVM17092.1 Hsp20/alpha crystallin family protein [Oceanidesulfovibrio indonesiensis]